MSEQYLELNENDLFRNGQVFVLDNGDKLLLRNNLEIFGTITDKYHTVTKTDRLDVLAWRYYKNFATDASKYWWVIADANLIMNPLDLTEYVGVSILIPNLNKILLTL